MANIHPKQNMANPWGDDHPEKLTKTGRQTIGFNQQLKSLVNPAGMLDQLFGQRTSSEHAFNPNRKETASYKRETTIFSRNLKEQETQIQNETKFLLKQLKEQVTLLEKSEKTLTSQIAKIKVEQIPSKSGIYYLRFFEWLIGLVKQLRIKVEEGSAWLAAFTHRQKKRMGYWRMYKKHGTTFGMSHERTLATQTG